MAAQGPMMSKKSSPSSKARVAYRSSSRRNGWSCPPHPLQFAAWIFIAVFAVMFHSVAVPTIPYHWQPACHMIVGVMLAVHVVTHLVCLTVDPADPSTRRRDKKVMPEFDRTRHKHVIENNHCYLCEVDVGLKSKHCSSCNKCVADFDHHCKWLNNCVGSRNYRWFITCLSSAFLCCLFVFAVFLYISIVYWVNPQLLHPELYDGAVTTQPAVTADQLLNTSPTPTPDTSDPLVAHRSGLRIFAEVSGVAFFVVAVVLAVLLLVTLCLLGHLLGFHVFLIYHDMSTYDYVMQDRNAFISGDVEAQRKSKPRERGCCKCQNQVAPLPEAKEEIEMTDTKKDSTPSQLDQSHNNSNCNLQQQLVISEPLIKQEQQQQQQQVQNPQSTAATDSKPKTRKKKKSKRKSQRLRALTAREALQPVATGRAYPPSQLNLTHSVPQTYLEQHLVRRYSLPLVTPAGMHPPYPVAEPVEDLFFTQQFPTAQRHAPKPQAAQTRQWRPIPLPAAISFDSPTPAVDYRSSSAESLVEIPVGRAYHRGSVGHPAQRDFPPGGGYRPAAGYPLPVGTWCQGHSSHPNLTANGGNPWPPDVRQLGEGVAARPDSNSNSASHLKKSKRTSARTKKDKVTNVSTAAKPLNESERTRRHSIKEPLLVTTVRETESQMVPDADRPDEQTERPGMRAKKHRSLESVETTADVHRQPDGPSEMALQSSNDNRAQRTTGRNREAKTNTDARLQDGTGSETRTRNGQVPPATPVPVAAPRRRTLKPGQEPSGSRTSLKSSSSHQHLPENADTSGTSPTAGRSRKDHLQDGISHDAVSLPGSIPEVPPLDLRPLADAQDSDAASAAGRPPSDRRSLSDEQLAEGDSAEEVDSKPLSWRRSLMLHY